MSRNEIISNIRSFKRDSIRQYLLSENENQQILFEAARSVREKSTFKNFVELRSVIELSNICSQKCRYCSMSKASSFFRLKKEDILQKIKFLSDIGRKTFLLQSGENNNQGFIDDLSYCCQRAVELYPDIRIILCCGNLSKEQYKQLKEAGAKRYILKFETSNPEHHKFCRPSDTIENRLNCIKNLIDVGFETGSGNIVGLPKQTLDDLIDDLYCLKNLKLKMASTTKFIPNENSEFEKYPPGSINLTLNFLAILRILKPDCLIPATSSLETGSSNGQINGLMAGCNTLTIHDGTPSEVEKDYSIYSKERFIPKEQYCVDLIKKAGMEAKKYLL